jgi:hypothetical protein
MPSPKTDDFRIERSDERLIVTFTPDGRSYSFAIGGGTGEPLRSTPPRAAESDYSDSEVEEAAKRLAALALDGAPRR